VHWKNPTAEDVVVKPFLLLAPPIDDRALMQSTATTARRSVWTVVDATDRITAVGTMVPGSGDDPGNGSGGGGGAGGRDGVQLTVVPRSVNGERIRKLELRGDLRYVPVGELAGRLDAALRSRGAPGPAARSATIRRRGRSRRP
jgi:hypothetical protein